MLIRLCNEKKMYYDTKKSFRPHVNEVYYQEKIILKQLNLYETDHMFQA